MVLAIVGRLASSLSHVIVGLGDPQKTHDKVTSSFSKTAISLGLYSTVGGTRRA